MKVDRRVGPLGERRHERVGGSYADEARHDLEVEISRATATMPDLLRAVAAGDACTAYTLLRRYQAANRLERGFAGVALLALTRGWRRQADRMNGAGT